MYLITNMYRHTNIDLPRHELFLLGREFQAKLCPGVWTEPSAGPTFEPSSTACSVPVQPVTIINNTSAAHTRMP